MIYEVAIGNRVRRVEIVPSENGFVVRLDEGPPREVSASACGHAEWLLENDAGKQTLVGLHIEGEAFTAQIEGHAVRGTVMDPRRKAFSLGGSAAQGEIRSPMPGIVVRIPVKQGESVMKGQVLVVVEAMKMENEFKSPVDGRVEAVHVGPGQPVEANTLLVTVKEGE